MFSIQFNAGATRDALAKARAGLADLAPTFRDIGEYMLGATKDRFASGVGPDGVPWAPKAASTIEHYKRLGYGTLTRPLTGPSRRLGSEIQRIVSGDGVVIGSSLVYAGVMQDGAAKGAFGRTPRGGYIPWGRIPARTWLGISDADETAIVEIAEEHLAADLGGADR